MQQSCTYGSVRGAISNGRPYRDKTTISREIPRFQYAEFNAGRL
jgi:hypothetical protein